MTTHNPWEISKRELAPCLFQPVLFGGGQLIVLNDLRNLKQKKWGRELSEAQSVQSLDVLTGRAVEPLT